MRVTQKAEKERKERTIEIEENEKMRHEIQLLKTWLYATCPSFYVSFHGELLFSCQQGLDSSQYDKQHATILNYRGVRVWNKYISVSELVSKHFDDPRCILGFVTCHRDSSCFVPKLCDHEPSEVTMRPLVSICVGE
ncbi:hypothetical protein RRG08_056783 [Elysia crispata]|uniref:Uncharacterized protein n=1 Tax=Elysia crispata TaxID=231223 RepID=A0AAE0XQA0_9GAST|nr:hypothetical protein RRG08_056783 [Elysia crispata]